MGNILRKISGGLRGYIGGKQRNVGRRAGMDKKTMVLGAIQRGGQLRLKVDNRADRVN